ncbi:unnamed protein product [Allacma fusca]|uniref:Uncharacterized protein n=1 Tax=Allacma fusca TaxID=39272 RepID=A0A8J2JIG0_9HEXA|nr:unnamed protein product [Allacma fusca]
MLGQTGYLMYPLLLREILEKLPVQMQMNWCMRATEFTNEPTLEDFSEWLSKLSLAACRMPAASKVIKSDAERNDKPKESLKA